MAFFFWPIHCLGEGNSEKQSKKQRTEEAEWPTWVGKEVSERVNIENDGTKFPTDVDRRWAGGQMSGCSWLYHEEV